MRTLRPVMALTMVVALLLGAASPAGAAAVTITSGAPRSPMVLGQVYAIHTVEAAGGTEPYHLSVSAGSLPPGMLVVGNSLGGSPTTAGTYTFTLRMTDAADQFAEQTATIEVREPTVEITSGAPRSPMVLGQVYAIHTVEAAGGTEPYHLSVSAGSLPPGMLVVGNSLGGSPTTAGTYTFTLRMTDAADQFAEQTATIEVREPTVEITSGAPRSPMVLGQVYAIHTVEAAGGTEPYHLSVSAGSLPPGMLVVGNSLGGSPTTAGTYPATLRMTDKNGFFGEQDITIVVAETATPTPTATPTGPIPTPTAPSATPTAPSPTPTAPTVTPAPVDPTSTLSPSPRRPSRRRRRRAGRGCRSPARTRHSCCCRLAFSRSPSAGSCSW
ncbi:hypothetical protein GCM10029963_31810 [Micromonospora andamanensis]